MIEVIIKIRFIFKNCGMPLSLIAENHQNTNLIKSSKFLTSKYLVCGLLLLHILYAGYSEQGQFEVLSETSSIVANNGEPLEYSMFLPVGSDNLTYIILSHGFSRNKSVMAGLANHFASWGLNVITVDLLHASIFDNDPLQDANDLNLIAHQICGDVPIIYAGQSAGGMRSIVAAYQDTNAIAVLGLDLVDASNPSWSDGYLALTTAANISIPVWGLHGEASSCNANGNGLSVFTQAASGNAIRVTNADHCDFELPTNILCTLLCQESSGDFTDQEIQNIILNLSTGFLLYHSEVSTSSIQLWYPGNEYYDSQISIGAIEQLTYLANDINEPAPSDIMLYENYPNPFNPSTIINFDLHDDAIVKITIYDLSGNLVNNLLNSKLTSGHQTVKWNATDNQGQKVSSGVYLYNVDIGDFVRSGKMVKLK